MRQEPDDQPRILSDKIKLFIAALWAIGFCLLFYSFSSPNGNYHVRWDIFLQIPELLMNALAPLQQENVPSIGWSNISQRFGIVLVSAMILSATWALGSLLLRMVSPTGLLDRLERILFSFAVGISVWTLVTLILGMMGFLSRPLFLGMAFVLIFFELGQLSRKKVIENKKQNQRKKTIDQSAKMPAWLSRVSLGLIGFSFLWMLLGALLPSTDFDVREYHLQGPKEYFQNGNVTLLPHNVYTSFPFLTEMISLSAMVIKGDWYSGALAGKGMLACFAPLTALALFCAGRRWFGESTGWLAALIFMTTPWVHRISVIAYAEGGLTFYLMMTLFAVMIALEKNNFTNIISRRKQLFMTGFLAGSAMACKYPAALTVVIPLFTVVGIVAFLSEPETQKKGQVTLKLLTIIGIGFLIAVGPWLIKNTMETKNPVYPLVYSVLGSDQWDATMDAKWKAAHSASHHRLLGDRGMKYWLEDLSARNDWLSPLLYAFSPLAFLVILNKISIPQKKMIACLWGYLFFLFFAWWGFTHRLDRFWVPMIPVVALLAGVGLTWSDQKSWKWIAGICCAVGVFFNLGLNVSALCGNNRFLYNYDYLKQASTSPAVKYLNNAHRQSLENNTQLKVLCVGEAAVFEAEFPLVYNTVFDDSIFQEWTAKEERDPVAENIQMKGASFIRAKFAEEKITHVLVNWQEILRYRMSYGYTKYVTPQRLTELQQMGILNHFPYSLPRPFDQFSKAEQAEIKKWAPELLVTRGGTQAVIISQVYTVK